MSLKNDFKYREMTPFKFNNVACSRRSVGALAILCAVPH